MHRSREGQPFLYVYQDSPLFVAESLQVLDELRERVEGPRFVGPLLEVGPISQRLSMNGQAKAA